MQTIKITVLCDCNSHDDDNSCPGQVEHDLPARMFVCDRCEGNGAILNPSIGEHAYTEEEFNREFSEDEKAEYFKRGGMYDVVCPECKGKNVVLGIDDDALNPEQKKTVVKYRRAERQAAQERANELRTMRGEMGIF